MLRLAAALALTLAATTPASAQTDPVSRVSWSSGTGTVLCLGLGTPLKAPHAGEGVVVSKCGAVRPGQDWDFTGDVLRPYGSALSVVAVASSGRLVLSAAAGTVWTYGPGHTLTAAGPAGTEYLAYCGTGRYPVLGATCGTTWYVFTEG